MAAHLPAASLPLRFEVPLSLKGRATAAFSSTSLSPCVYTVLNGVNVYRTLDPGLETGFISLGRVLQACGLTVLEGLSRFRKPTSTDLGGLAPFHSIWMSLDDAHEVAIDLQCEEELAGLLDTRTAKAWTVLDYEEGNEPSLLSNWRIPPNSLGPVHYATDTMLRYASSPISALAKIWYSTSFPCLLMTSSDLQVRTQLDASLLLPASRPEKPSLTFDTLHSSLTIWANLAYSCYEAQLSDQATVEQAEHFRSQLWNTLTSLLKLNETPSTPQLSENMREYTIGEEVVMKSEAVSGSLKGHLVLVDMVNLLALQLGKRQLEDLEIQPFNEQAMGDQGPKEGWQEPIRQLKTQLQAISEVAGAEKDDLQATKNRLAKLEASIIEIGKCQKPATSIIQLPQPKSRSDDWRLFLLGYLLFSYVLYQAGIVTINVPKMKWL